MEIEAGTLFTREQVLQALEEGFSITFGDRMLRYAIEALGLAPKATASRTGTPGAPLTYYDPILVWTIASVYHRQRQLLKQGQAVLDPFRALAAKYNDDLGTGVIPGFREDVDFAAQLLLIGSPDLGLDPLHRMQHLQRQHWLLDCCSQGRVFMKLSLMSWNKAYSIGAGGDPEAVPSTREDLRDTFAYWFLHDWIETAHQLEDAPDS